MALFSRKPKTEAKKAAPKAEKPQAVIATPAQGSGTRTSLAHVLKQARITEKATESQASGVYVFEVASSATKRDILLAVKELYSVTPRKVAVVNVKSKERRNMRTGRVGIKKGGKKAYVYLKSGDTITIS